MRRLLIVIILFLPFAGKSQIKIGARAGVNLANIVNRPYYNDEKKYTGAYLLRPDVGLMIQIPLNDNDNWFIYTGPNYSGKGNRLRRHRPASPFDSVVTYLNYIELPVSLSYKFSEGNNNRFITGAGVYAGYGFKGKILYHNDPVHTERNLHRKDAYFKRLDAGFSVHAMYEIKSKWGFRADYSRSILDITRYGNKENNNIFGFSFFCYFGKKKEKKE